MGDVTTTSHATFTHTYDKIPEVKELIMTVTLWQQWLGQKLWRIETVENKFQLSRNLIGALLLHQPETPQAAIMNHTVSTAADVNVSFLLHDPSGFFDHFDKKYSWTVNGKDINDTQDSLSVTLSPPGEYNVSCNVIVISEKLVMDRNVDLTSRIIAKDPIKELKFAGKYFIPRNPGLDLNVSCVSGTGPFSFCKEVKNISEIETDNCTEVLISGKKDCFFHVPWYFREAGKYNLWVRVSNDVSTLFQKVEISVMDFKIQPSITFVVIPVVSSIMAIFIIVFGIALHVQQRRRGFTIEVADFDFSARNDSDLLVKTFFERLRESLVSSVKGVTFSSLFKSTNRRGTLREDHDDGYASRSLET